MKMVLRTILLWHRYKSHSMQIFVGFTHDKSIRIPWFSKPLLRPASAHLILACMAARPRCGRESPFVEVPSSGDFHGFWQCSGSKPWYPCSSHQNSWFKMDVHPTKNGLYRYWSIAISRSFMIILDPVQNLGIFLGFSGRNHRKFRWVSLLSQYQFRDLGSGESQKNLPGIQRRFIEYKQFVKSTISFWS